MYIMTMDPNMLVSIINMKLRDNYSNLDMLCEDMDLNKDALKGRLKEAQYTYCKETNQFK